MRLFHAIPLTLFFFAIGHTLALADDTKLDLPGLLEIDGNSATTPLSVLSGTKNGMNYQFELKRVAPELKCRIVSSWDGTETETEIGSAPGTSTDKYLKPGDAGFIDCDKEQPGHWEDQVKRDPRPAASDDDRKSYEITDTGVACPYSDRDTIRELDPGKNLYIDAKSYVYERDPSWVEKSFPSMKNWTGYKCRGKAHLIARKAGDLILSRAESPTFVNSKTVAKSARLGSSSLAEVDMDQAACLVKQREEFEKLKNIPLAAAFLKKIGVKGVKVEVKDFRALPSYQTKVDSTPEAKLTLAIAGDKLDLGAYIDESGKCVPNDLKHMLARISDFKKKFDFVAANALTKPAVLTGDCDKAQPGVIASQQKEQLQSVSRALAKAGVRSCADLGDLSKVAAHTRCATTKGSEGIFERVVDKRFGKGWKAPDGSIWTDDRGLFFNNISDSDAAKACDKIGGHLPTQQKFFTFARFFESDSSGSFTNSGKMDFFALFPGGLNEYWSSSQDPSQINYS